jgi:hypothetical protein
MKLSFHTLNLCILLSEKFNVLCNTFKNGHVNRSVRAVQNSNLFNRTSSLRQPMAANVNQTRPNIRSLPSIVAEKNVTKNVHTRAVRKVRGQVLIFLKNNVFFKS